ncbi:hypothetical protein ACS0TY_020007 [Phlomoides rotata]
MASVKAIEEAEFPEKRKLDLPISANKSLEEDKDVDDSNKRQKLEIPPGENGSLSHPAGENVAKSDEHPDVKAASEEADDEDYNAEQDGDEEVRGEAVIIDIKGKGIMRDDKGKGKMIEDTEDDDSDGLDGSDDDSSDDSDSDFSDGLGDSDLDEDPLAEVDLDNILPSRTRQRQVQRGVVIKDSAKGKDMPRSKNC